MSNRPLAILSEGRLSESQVTALTLLSLGWIEVELSPAVVTEILENRKLRVIYTGQDKEPINYLDKQRRAEDEEIIAIIHTFIEWQASGSV